MYKMPSEKFMNETEIFTNAVDEFFGLSPYMKYWILLPLLFAKKRWITIEEGRGRAEGIVLCSKTISDLEDFKKSQAWTDCGITESDIVINVPDSLRNTIEEIMYAFDVDAIEAMDRHKSNGNSFWGKSKKANQVLYKIVEQFNCISDNWYNQNSEWAFDYILQRIQLYDGAKGVEFVQPKEVTAFALSLLDIRKGRIYNPFSGVCSYGIGLNSQTTYVAQEICHTYYILGKINMLLNSDAISECKQGDSYKDWLGGDNFDYIIATPPFGWINVDGKKVNIDEHFLLHAAIDSHNASLGIFREGICFNRGSREISPIEQLVRLDLIEAVIALPSDIFTMTSIPTVAILTRKDKTNKGYVKLVDASDCYIKEGRKRIFDYQKALTRFSDSTNPYVIDVPLDVISQNDNNVYPQYYLLRNIPETKSGMTIRSLSSVLECAGDPVRKVENGKIFTFNKFESAIDENFLDEKDIPMSHVESGTYQKISDNALILLDYSSSKALYLQTAGKEVLVPSYYKVFQIIDKEISPAYLISELQQPYFRKQLSRFGNGFSTKRTLLPKDFLSCKIYVPEDNSSQRHIVLSRQGHLVKEALQNIQEIETRRFEDFLKAQRDRKHSVGQVINDIMPAFENIMDFINSGNDISKDSVMSRRFGTTLGQYLNIVHRQLIKLEGMVDKFTKLETFGEPENIDLYNFLTDYCNGKTNEVFRAVYNPEREDPDEMEPGEEPSKFLVRINSQDLTTILDNLFDNARKYGFVDQDKAYEIRLMPIREYSGKIPMANIRVLNNGVPVSKSISLDQLFSWGIGQGTGTGCSLIKEIAEHFGGSASYQEYPDNTDGFSCEFSIRLPLIEE